MTITVLPDDMVRGEADNKTGKVSNFRENQGKRFD